MPRIIYKERGDCYTKQTFLFSLKAHNDENQHSHWI